MEMVKIWLNILGIQVKRHALKLKKYIKIQFFDKSLF